MASPPPIVPPLDLPPLQDGEPLVTAVYADKGGVGKSTIATVLAYQLARQDQGPVVLIDVNADQQESSSKLIYERLKVDPGYDCVVEDDPANLAAVRQIPNRRHIILDLPPSPDEAHHGLQQAHVVLVPLFPEFLGTRAVMETVRRILPRVSDDTAGPVPVLVMSRIPPVEAGSSSIRELRNGFEGLGVRVADTVMRQYKAHSHAQAAGVPVTHSPDAYDRGDKAAADVEALTDEFVAMTRKAFE